MTVAISQTQWIRLSEFLVSQIGLHFPPGRQPDLERGLLAAARDFEFAEVPDCVDWLLTSSLTRRQVEVLASHLTVGETYFFRDSALFQVLREKILPELIAARRETGRHLRLWSAGCATGEEPYSIAIYLCQLIPDWKDWSITLLGTDINPGFLRKAGTGIFKEWSFRSIPAGLKEAYFERSGDGGWRILPEIKEKVTFSYLNLAEDSFPSLVNNTNAMDIIFCRNVLMYFAPERVHKVAQNFHRALLEGGWLVVSPTEASQEIYSDFETVNFPGSTLYRKISERTRKIDLALPMPVLEQTTKPPSLLVPYPSEEPSVIVTLQSNPENIPSPLVPAPEPVLTEAHRNVEAQVLYEQGRYAEAGQAVEEMLFQNKPDVETLVLLARIRANQGHLAEALASCEEALNLDKLNAGVHYLRAMILQELGDLKEAQTALQRVLYLDPRFVLAHFSLGHVSFAQDQPGRARKFFQNALALLRACQAEETLPESEGMTAGRLKEIIQSLCPGEKMA